MIFAKKDTFLVWFNSF